MHPHIHALPDKGRQLCGQLFRLLMSMVCQVADCDQSMRMHAVCGVHRDMHAVCDLHRLQTCYDRMQPTPLVCTALLAAAKPVFMYV